MSIKCILIASLLVACVFGLPYSAKSPVVTLTYKNFAENVFGSEHPWMVEFYAPWCGHCKNLSPDYEKAAESVKGIVRIGAVNCDDNDNKPLCSQYDIKGFPTLKVFPSKLVPVKGKKDAYHKVPVDYQGARSAAAISKAVLAELPSFVTAVSSAKLEKFLSDPLPKAILFSDKGKTSDLYKALSVDFHNRMLLGEAKHTDKQLVEQYNIEKFPTLLVIGGEGKEDTKFEGTLGHAALFKFLSPFAVPETKKPSSSGSDKKSAPAEPEEQETGEVYHITDASVFQTKCVEKGLICAIAFLDKTNMLEEEIKAYLATLKEAGSKIVGRLRLFWADASTQPDMLTVFDVPQSYPNMLIFSPKKNVYTRFMGSFSSDSISEFFSDVLTGAKKKFVKLDRLPNIAGDVKVSEKKAPTESVKEEKKEEAPKAEKKEEAPKKEKKEETAKKEKKEKTASQKKKDEKKPKEDL